MNVESNNLHIYIVNTKCNNPNLRPNFVKLKQPQTEVAWFQDAAVEGNLIWKHCQNLYWSSSQV